MALLALGMALPTGACAAACWACWGWPWRSPGSLLSPSRRVGAAVAAGIAAAPAAGWGALRSLAFKLLHTMGVRSGEMPAGGHTVIQCIAKAASAPSFSLWSQLLLLTVCPTLWRGSILPDSLHVHHWGCRVGLSRTEAHLELLGSRLQGSCEGHAALPLPLQAWQGAFHQQPRQLGQAWLRVLQLLGV